MQFFKKIFVVPEKPSKTSFNSGRVLYFTLDKTKYLPITLSKELTCQALHIQYHNDIGNKIAKLPQLNQTSKSDLSFIIIDSSNQFNRIKLKQTDIPFKYITSTSDIYYINPSESISTNTNKEIISPQKKLMNIVNPEEVIRVGELKKYSFKQKQFMPRTVLIDKDKLMITVNEGKTNKSQNMNIWSVILFSEINTINKKISENDLPEKKHLFEIETTQNDKIILKARNNSDQEGWIEIINLLVKQTKENKYFNIYSSYIQELTKEIYEKEMNILFGVFTIKGTLALHYSRYLLFKQFHSKIIPKIIEGCLTYKENITKKDYINAYINFREVMSDLSIDAFDIKDNYGISMNLKNSIFETIQINVKELVHILLSHEKIVFYQMIIKKIDEFLSKGNNHENFSNDSFSNILSSSLLQDIYDSMLKKILHDNYKTILFSNKDYQDKLTKIFAIDFKHRNQFSFNNLLP